MRPQPAKKALDQYYRQEFTYSLDKAEVRRLEDRARIVIRTLRSLSPSAMSLLDIGSGGGQFLQVAKKAGLAVYGIEPSLRLFRRLKKTFGSDVENSDWETFRLKSRAAYDVITVSHVIEHVSSPIKFLEELSLLLNHRGLLYIETPNFDSHLRALEKSAYTFLSPPQHLWVLSANFFRLVLKNSLILSKMRLMKIQTYSYPEHFVGLIRILLRRRNAPYHSNRVGDKTSPQPEAPSLRRFIRYHVFHRCIAPLLHRLLNFRNKGSIVGLYLQKQ